MARLKPSSALANCYGAGQVPEIADAATAYELNTISLEDWAPGQPDERWCAVEVTERYLWDGRERLRVRVMEGPEAGRIVSGLSQSNLRERTAVPRNARKESGRE